MSLSLIERRLLASRLLASRLYAGAASGLTIRAVGIAMRQRQHPSTPAPPRAADFLICLFVPLNR
jgi:hypothetical protein